MQVSRKFSVLIAMTILVIAGIAAVPSAPNNYKNLKVLPKDISTKDLSRIMIDEFEDGLGVSCGFCHAEEKDSHKLDYASDEKPEKEIARLMMKMTLDVNEKYFQVTHPLIGDSVLSITCMTCHKGQPRPRNPE
ncbi:MAG TPA: c-type cytochrome [Chitinophagaceae bacterium]|nr:c-type cytochrome [Chitinophagaceae bacterium]